MTFLSQAEKQQVADAIRQVELKTSGELVAVIADASDHYAYIPLLWASLCALMLPAVFMLLNIAADQLMLYQLLVFSLSAVLFRWTPVKMRVIPAYVRQQRARRVAREQFLLQGLHHTAQRNGVLLFVSVAERYVELIADKGVNDVVDNNTWENLVSEFTRQVKAGSVVEGFVSSIESVGEILQHYFPATDRNINELQNHLVELGIPD